MSIDTTALFDEHALRPPAGDPTRYGRRWRLIGAGLSNVWLYGDLELPAPSGRLLLRGPNGTGKTTALEALLPFLLDLNPHRLAAGKARNTSLRLLMSTGETKKRRYGYAWMSFAAPDTEEVHSYGVRLQYSEGASPAVKVIPFTIPGRPLHELTLHGPGRAPLMIEQFAEAVEAAGGHVFDSDIAYVTELGARMWQCSPADIAQLASRLREVRNPTLLGEVSPAGAANALRASLPGVSDDVIGATAEALEGSAATREAFARDRADAQALGEFAELWAGHVTDVTNAVHAEAVKASGEQQRLTGELRRLQGLQHQAASLSEKLGAKQEDLKQEQQELAGHIEALKDSEAFKQAGVMNQLRATLTAEEATAEAEVTALTDAAHSLTSATSDLAGAAQTLLSDLEELDATTGELDAGRQSVSGCVEHETRPAGVLSVGEHIVDPGPTLIVRGEPQRLRDIAEDWKASAEKLRRRADSAQLMIGQHKPVDAALTAAHNADQLASAAISQAERSAEHAVRDTGIAQTAASDLLDGIALWSRREDLVPLRDSNDPDDSSQQLVTAEDVDQARGAEPAQVLGTAEGWAETALAVASQVAAQLTQQSQAADKQAKELLEQAEAHRQEAGELRSGRLLPLPRPDWADEVDDSTALGSAIDWRDSVSPDERARIELALAASGVLSATLADDEALTARWRLTTQAPECADSLGSVLTVDPAHPQAQVAEQVLRRIALGDHATITDGTQALTIGRDGTFAIGVAVGAPEGSRPGESAPAASFIGAAQRRAAALRQAEERDRLAAQTDQQASSLRDTAQAFNDRSAAAAAAGTSFPSRKALRTAESNRATSARAAADDRTAADQLGREALEAHEQHRTLARQWTDDVLALELPADLHQLSTIAEQGSRHARDLDRAATKLATRSAATLEQLHNRVADLAARREGLPTQLHRARAAHGLATKTARKLATLEADSGEDVAATLREIRAAETQRESIDEQLITGEAAARQAGEEAARYSGLIDGMKQAVAEAQPKAEKSLTALRRLLAAPGVTDVLLSIEPLHNDDLLTQVEQALAGRKTTAKRRTMLAGYDDIRARLAGTWALDNADPVGELQTYTLTHRDAVYSPPQAARRAEHLAGQAEQALASAEEQALRDFIIGRLPIAINTAWTHLHTWINEVNKKMRSATASSGVGVQVRINLSDDMSPASRRVYELCCKTALALRSDADNAELGAALQSLMDAADGETMTERIAAAVDVRDWVDVHYEVTRPGADKPERWGQRTGLSGGERRLVVLAPMLAAVAAAYDRFPDTALRLAALDEVPAEVDEQGRESLARYLAALDLDLICTSYLWDGAPGAWDGIDAHDLEAGPDGTVVAFPMLIRGDELLPGDGHTG
jgi:hypothetical protein